MSEVFCVMVEIAFKKNGKTHRFAPSILCYYGSLAEAWRKARLECDQRMTILAENGVGIMEKANAFLKYKTAEGIIYEYRYTIHAVKAGD